MDNQMRPRYAGVSEALPGVLMVWKLGQRLLAKAEHNPAARTWARVGVAGAVLVGAAALAVGLLASLDAALPAPSAEESDRLDEALEESFPASDAPAVTRAG